MQSAADGHRLQQLSSANEANEGKLLPTGSPSPADEGPAPAPALPGTTPRLRRNRGIAADSHPNKCQKVNCQVDGAGLNRRSKQDRCLTMRAAKSRLVNSIPFILKELILLTVLPVYQWEFIAPLEHMQKASSRKCLAQFMLPVHTLFLYCLWILQSWLFYINFVTALSLLDDKNTQTYLIHTVYSSVHQRVLWAI